MPKELDFSKLKELKPRSRVTDDALRKHTHTHPHSAFEKAVEDVSKGSDTPKRWPSREAPLDGQFTIRAPLEVIENFKYICKEDRRTYGAMLEILVDLYNKKLT